MLKVKKNRQNTVKIDAKKVKSGDLMAFTYWAKVKSFSVDNRFSCKLEVVDLDNSQPLHVIGDVLIERATSADQFQNTVKVTKSESVDILSNARNIPFTVTFLKKDGSERVLRGRLIGIDQKNLGYIDVEDLDEAVGDRFRLVDCRTILSIVVNNTKYVVQ